MRNPPGHDPPQASQILWLNGRFVPADEASVSPLDRGFLYGDGLFETMRVENGSVLYLDDHLERLRNSLADLRIQPDAGSIPPDWRHVFGELLERNGLMEGIASVKIIMSRGISPGPGLPDASHPTTCLIARRYESPSPATYGKGWRLEVFREGFSPPLARHKSLNYLYFLAAKQAALDAGADEALITDPRGNITETSTGSIIARTDGHWWTPCNPFQLPGTTIRQVSKILSAESVRVEPRAATVEDLKSADTVWVLNSLMLIMPISRIGEHRVPDIAEEEASHLREELIRRGMRG